MIFIHQQVQQYIRIKGVWLNKIKYNGNKHTLRCVNTLVVGNIKEHDKYD